MKKTLPVITAAILLLSCLNGCAGTGGTTENVPSGDAKLQIASTVFPTYDFAKQICGNTAEVTLLVPPGSEIHSFEPSAQDLIRIRNCDLFLYTGGESDSWVDDLLSSAGDGVKTIKMMDCVDTVAEEVVDGMTSGHEHEHEHEETAEYDEHVWTSPQNAMLIAEAITDAVCELSPGNKEFYQSNEEDYLAQLNSLDESFSDFFATVSNKTLIFGDRFPLRYFADEYGLTYYAAFPGCSTQTEPSAATIAFLTDKVRREEISTVFYIEFSNHLVADSIAESTGARTAMFHACHNVSPEELSEGVTYLSLMKQNLETLKKAMG